MGGEEYIYLFLTGKTWKLLFEPVISNFGRVAV
jgi:hypothetical protein